MTLNFRINRRGVELCAEKEGCRLRAYRNFPEEPWTCGWGETDGVGPNTVWTQEFADQRFCDSLNEYAAAVLEACTVEPNENQLSAMTVLAYNIGLGWKGKKKPAGAKDGFRQSSVLKNHNLGKFQEAAESFRKWNKIKDGKGGLRVLDSLTSRRLSEAALYMEPPEGSQQPSMPQVVAPEKKLTQSPSVITAAAGSSIFGLDFIVEAGKNVEVLKPAVVATKDFLGDVKGLLGDALGISADWLMPALAAAMFALLLWRRYDQNKRGIA